jgi:hypothetical protein
MTVPADSDSVLIALDPALRKCGVCIVFRGRYFAAVRIRNPQRNGTGFQAWDCLVQAVCAWMRSIWLERWKEQGFAQVTPIFSLPLTVVVETMETHGLTAAADLNEIQGVIGALLMSFRLHSPYPVKVAAYVPKEWKRQAPKAVTTRRLNEHFTALARPGADPASRAEAELYRRDNSGPAGNDDLEDATCLAFHHIGRLQHSATRKQAEGPPPARLDAPRSKRRPHSAS